MQIKLVMFKANGQRKDFSISGETTVIGRAENCELRVPIESVSRRHCQLIISAGQVQVKDLGSANGTYVNNDRITEVALNAGDRLVVGPIVFTVQIDGVPEEIHRIKTKGQQLDEVGQADQSAETATSEPPLNEAELFATASSQEQIDPISALEALADDEEPQENDDEKS